MLEVLYIIVAIATWFAGSLFFAKHAWHDKGVIATISFFMTYIYGCGHIIAAARLYEVLFP